MIKREERYLVFKFKDLEEANLKPQEHLALLEIVRKVNLYRFSRDKEDLKCVVVEDDWDCYEDVWQLIEAETFRKLMK